MNQHALLVAQGDRFEFGKNWSAFLRILDDERVDAAKRSLSHMLGVGRLDGKSFLDIGSGSGLFSLAARLLGARVCSFDYDLQSVACTAELRRRYLPDDSDWTVTSGSILDDSYLGTLGRYDVVYSWGVLHHTGQMWKALENAAGLVGEGGTLLVAIYNDQGRASHHWRAVKKLYCKSSVPTKAIIGSTLFLFLESRAAINRLIHLENPLPFKRWEERKRYRGMSPWYDAIDWAGGYPFEVAKPEEVFDFCRFRGFEFRRLKTCAGGHGCNEYVFERTRLRGAV